MTMDVLGIFSIVLVCTALCTACCVHGFTAASEKFRTTLYGSRIGSYVEPNRYFQYSAKVIIATIGIFCLVFQPVAFGLVQFETDQYNEKWFAMIMLIINDIGLFASMYFITVRYDTIIS